MLLQVNLMLLVVILSKAKDPCNPAAAT